MDFFDFLFNRKEGQMALTRDEIQQVVQQAVQAALEQAQLQAQGVQTAGQLNTGKTITGFEDVSHDIGMDEALKNLNLNDSQKWSFNNKLTAAIENRAYMDDTAYAHALKAIELKERNLAIAEREAKLRHQTKLDSLELRTAENAEVSKHYANHLHLDFRASVNESQLPLVDDDKTAQAL